MSVRKLSGRRTVMHRSRRVFESKYPESPFVVRSLSIPGRAPVRRRSEQQAKGEFRCLSIENNHPAWIERLGPLRMTCSETCSLFIQSRYLGSKQIISIDVSATDVAFQRGQGS